MNVLLIGRTGSGKSALGGMLAERFNLETISSDMYWDYVRSRREGWESLDAVLKNGGKVPDEIFFSCLREVVAKTQGKNGFVYEGSILSGERFAFVQELTPLDHCFYLDVKKSTADARSKHSGKLAYLQNREDLFVDFFAGLKPLVKDKLKYVNGEGRKSDVHREVAAAVRGTIY